MAFDAAETKRRLEAGCAAIIDATDRLTEADRAIGDGDHGVGMARGFRAAQEALAKPGEPTPGEMLKAVGMAILTKAGGASGAVFGSFFMGAAKAVEGPSLSADAFCAALKAGLDAVAARGGAGPGDKTVIDALIPAIDAAKKAAPEGIEAAASAAAEGAAAGLEATRDMVAQHGKARSLGERSLGFVDPGAMSMTLFLTAFADG